MPARKNPETSNEAYRSLTIEELNDIYRKILSALADLGQGTFEDISAKLKVDKSRIWKRLSELARMELIYRPGIKKPLQSGRNGYVWMLTSTATPKTEAQNKILKGKSVSDFSKDISRISKEVKQESLF